MTQEKAIARRSLRMFEPGDAIMADAIATTAHSHHNVPKPNTGREPVPEDNAPVRVDRHTSTRSARQRERVLRLVTGAALVAAAVGILIDEATCSGCPEGSIGLIPLYVGFPIGAIGFILFLYRAAGWLPSAIGGMGLAGILYFMFSYPNGADGWIGGVLIGIAHLFLPLGGRFPSVQWVAVGILGFPAFGQHSWGVVSAFTLFGAATLTTGVFVLWPDLVGLLRRNRNAPNPT